MRLPEQRFWDRLRPSMAARGVRVERVENGVSEGMGDVLAIADMGVPTLGLVTFLELKAIDKAPARGTSLL